jgi:serine/threonine protein kinase
MAYCIHCEEEHGDGVDFCPKTGRPITDVMQRMVGRTIAGRYKLARCIGQGGMGTIFEAEHTLIGSKVAVKLLHETFAQQREPVQRLYREARATGAIGHPNIIRVHDVGETSEGVPFLVMELLEGVSLGEHIERFGPQPIWFVLDVAEQMLSALHAAHEAGIIHRDLKSDNVFVLKADEGAVKIKILDFGISKFVDPEQENLKLTQTGSVLGTPYYMSPEQASGKKDLDRRIDIYSAGVILYECLVGAIPHSASNYNALLIQIITQDVKSFRRVRPDVPEKLEATILRALARRRDDRWATAVDFLEALVAVRRSLSYEVLHGAPLVNREDRPVDRDSATMDFGDVLLQSKVETPLAFENEGPREARRRSRRLFALGFVGSVALVIAVAATLLLNMRPGEPAAPVERDHAAKADPAEAGGKRGGGEPAAGATVKVVVERSPAEAEVTLSGRIVPVDGLEVPRGTAPLEVVVSAAGYAAQRTDLVPDKDVKLVVALEPEAVPKAAVKKGSGPKGAGKAGGGAGKKPDGDTAKGGGKEVAPAGGKAPGSGKPKGLDTPMDNPF